ncbi:ATP-binding protein [Limibaculum sp. FT325]|uniref:ATP-binding protein n=1 Tax=Thermohalobaculum sediminis TaxID=2939436 RepID=UPI0020C0ED67|nr:ATP-binding protein [Limibaculum sediminis]MCL5778220.1 ATP-binding protein [Limibaculum sediminis]
MIHSRNLDVLAAGVGAAAAALGAGAAAAPLPVAALAAAAGALAGSWLTGAWPARRPGAAAAPPVGPVRPSSRSRGAAALPGGAPAILEHMPHGVLLVDAAGRAVFLNASARRVFGTLPPPPFPAAALRVPRLLEAIDAARDGGQGDAVEGPVDFRLTRAAELDLAAHVIALDAAPDPATEAIRVLVVIEDRTQTRRAEQLHRDFVANASHELKTPLAAVSGLIETLTGHAKDDPEAQARFLGMMAAQTQRMKHLIEDLISLNRIEINERVHPRTPQPVTRILHEAIESLRPVADAAGMRIVAPPPDDLPTVPGNREELCQVFVNLIENALRYGRPSPEVRVRLLADDPDRPGMLGVAIEDDGPGIAREHIPRLTERFYRVSASRSRERGGTGLGLAIVKHILNRHRGQLAIESAPGLGARFTVWLPVAEPASRPAAAGAPQLRLASGG